MNRGLESLGAELRALREDIQGIEFVLRRAEPCIRTTTDIVANAHQLASLTLAAKTNAGQLIGLTRKSRLQQRLLKTSRRGHKTPSEHAIRPCPPASTQPPPPLRGRRLRRGRGAVRPARPRKAKARPSTGLPPLLLSGPPNSEYRSRERRP